MFKSWLLAQLSVSSHVRPVELRSLAFSDPSDQSLVDNYWIHSAISNTGVSSLTVNYPINSTLFTFTGPALSYHWMISWCYRWPHRMTVQSYLNSIFHEFFMIFSNSFALYSFSLTLHHHIVIVLNTGGESL